MAPAEDLVDRRYAIRGELGRGAMGVVYDAWDVNLERRVALKVMSPAALASATAIDGFRKEAAALARVRSDHVVQVFTFGPYESSLYFAMECVRGTTLETIIDEHARGGDPVPLPRALTILRQLAEGLAAVHDAGVLHRDVKPGNVVIEEGSGRAVLIDFGLARDALPLAGALDLASGSGTPAYMAPEQADDRFGQLSPRTDQYSLACTAYELLTGIVPFDASTTEATLQLHRHAPRPSLSLLMPELAPLDHVIARAMNARPEARWADCRAFLEALTAATRFLAERSAPEPDYETDGPISPRGDAWKCRSLTGETRPSVEVLVVDDDPVSRRHTARCAQLAFYRRAIRVRSVASGDAAIAAMAEAKPDLLLFDYSMPELDAVELLTRLRHLWGGSAAHAIAMVDPVPHLERAPLVALGVDDVIEKPIPLQALVLTIAEVAHRAHWAHALR